MWGRIARWYRDWEDEQLAVLENPALAAGLPPGWRRNAALKAASLSPVQRQELHRFSTTYRGWALWRAFAKLCLVFSVFGALFKLSFLPAKPLVSVVVAANALGLALVLVLIMVWFNHEKYSRPSRKLIGAIAGLGMLGGVYGAVVAMAVRGNSWQQLLDSVPRVMIITGFAVLLLVALPGFVVAVVRNRHFALLTAQLKQDAERERLARELSETQLRLLRAQIEPHFLFNTLGAVQQLAEQGGQGAARAAELTSHLIDFLRGSMSDMRCEQVALDTEFGLVDSYLRVMQVRIGERLRYTIDLPDALASTQVPSMLVLTLAENAIKHGIEPAMHGGEIAVTARADNGTLRIGVRDSGVGMSDTPGDGAGLENVRHRLRLAYGEGACLLLSEAEPGLLAEIAIPCKEQA